MFLYLIIVLLFQFLPNIQHLDLRHNKLCHFPVMALACSKLEILDISNNQVNISLLNCDYLMIRCLFCVVDN